MEEHFHMSLTCVFDLRPPPTPLTRIAQYLKITQLPISRARNVLESSNLDQWYLLVVSSDIQRDF